MGLLDRPYAGTWSPNKRKIVQYTPDALVYLNGDTSLSGCRLCRHNIDIQQFVTSLSVDAGIDPGAASASVTLSIPKSYGDSLFRDGNTLLRNGLEVHIYFRGYFPMAGMADPSEEVAGIKLGDVPQYPYYPGFHGVVTQVSHEYSGGYYSASLTCAGMLHFWQYMQIASNGAAFGARPTNSGVRTNLRGHVFTGMSPFSIIYSLYRDTAGAAAGVGFALQSRTNYRTVSSATGDSLYASMLRYWERRFMQRMYGLRMHGASGQLFSASQQAYLARLGGGDARVLSLVSQRASTASDPLANSAAELGLIDRDGDGRILRGLDARFLASSGGGRGDYGVVVPQMQAFVNDISQFGQVNLFESTYESKLDIATQVANICGYEFYQDMDGDLVFKPPLYNLDTSSSRVYRIEPEDIMSISFTESEPEATYATVSGGPFQNLRGAVDQAEWGVRSTYVDYRLVAQFGWREGSLQSNYYSNARSAYYAAVAQLDKLNQGMNSASVTIPLRPELRQGFPVYIPHIDCFYYVQSISHSFTFGGSCTTTLNLVARRRKFIPPGERDGESINSIKLDRLNLAPRALQYLDNSGVPRILGFPNVVMALDPTRINPLFFVFGLDAEEAGVTGRGRGGIETAEARQEQLATNFSQLLIQEGVLGLGSPESDLDTFDGDITVDAEGRITSATEIAGREQAQTAAPVTGSSASGQDPVLGPWFIQADDFRGRQVTADQLREGLISLVQVRGRVRGRIARVQRDIRSREAQLSRSGTAPSAQEGLTVEIADLRREASTLNEFLAGEASIGAVQTANAGLVQGVADVESVTLVNFLLSRVRQPNPGTASRDMSVDATGALNDSATILDILGDRKASLGINVPGYYRYYSSAHPDPVQQGYAPLTSADATSEEGEIPEGSEDDPSAGSDLRTVGIVALTGEDAESLGEDELRDFVQLQNVIPVNGLNVRTFASQEPTPTPTDQIYALSFEQRSSRRFGRTMYFVARTGDVSEIRRAFEACQAPGNDVGRQLGRVLASRVGESGLSNAGQTGGALVAAALSNVTGLVGSDGSNIDSDDISGGTPNNVARADGAVVTDAPVGGANTVSRAETILTLKAQALVQQVSIANRAGIMRALEILSENPLTREGSSPSATGGAATQASESDASLARRAGIPANVMRAIRAIESTSNPNVVRFETRLFRERTGQTIEGTNRTTFEQAFAINPQAAVESTSFGSYQVLGATLLRLESDPAAALRRFDENPQGVSDDLLVTYFREARPRLREIANGNPLDVAALAEGYNGSSQTRWASRFSAALASGTGAARSQTATRGGGTNFVLSGQAARDLNSALMRWRQDLTKLFGEARVSGLPFSFERRTGVVEEPLNMFSPVFPVSDAIGYEHYGTYQYGRGLSIEAGGNYERLMAVDPFEYVDPELAYRFADALRREGRLGDRTRAVLAEIASDATFRQSPGADIAIREYTEGSTDEAASSTAMIAAGLANYVMSDRDAVTKLPVSNSAFRLSEIHPYEQDETCECRGAEADLLLGAYMAGASATTFVSVDAPDKASQWAAQQMALAADSWSLSQEALRGSALSSDGRRSLFDTVQGIAGMASSLTAPVEQLENQFEGETERGLRRLNELAGRV